MKTLHLISFVGFLVPSALAISAEIPDFFEGGKTYASDWKACVGFAGDGAPDDSNTIDQSGVFGYEFGCTFVDFKPVSYNGRITSYIAMASCGDDSGINRPDFFDISFYDGNVTVTSQNDYIYDTLRPREDGDGESWGFINKQFELCQPE